MKPGDSGLEEFAAYLLERRLANTRQAEYMVRWVRMFRSRFAFARDQDPEEQRLRFVESLRGEGRWEDWQLEQAERAVRLFQVNFQAGADLKRKPEPRIAVDGAGRVCPELALASLREVLRMRHYSYRTEQTYLQWTQRFFRYARSLDKGNGDLVTVHPQTIKDFLAYLALKRHVSASTQNQAFNALLFLCRYILRVELGDLEQGLRARQGRRLPVVLTPAEVQALFVRLSGTKQIIAQLTYGGGLRVSETVRLRVKDLDFDQRLVLVRAGKGNKDRSTLLPAQITDGPFV